MASLFRSLAVSVFCITALSGCGPSFALSPLPYAARRPMLLTFGMYVTPDPAQNPIDPPERFIGYHTGLDFEIFPDEADKEVAVSAICDGRLIFSGFAEGYGGVAVERCILKGQEVTVLYGHLDRASLAARDAVLTTGDRIGVLGAAHSIETDGNRKHLHLDIHKGPDLQLLGYVQQEKELDAFIDPLTMLR